MIRLYEQRAQHVLVQTHLPHDFFGALRVATEVHAHVVAFARLLYIVGQTLLAHPLYVDGLGAVVLGHVREMRHQLVDVWVFERRAQYISYLVKRHERALPPYGRSACPKRAKARVQDEQEGIEGRALSAANRKPTEYITGSAQVTSLGTR